MWDEAKNNMKESVKMTVRKRKRSFGWKRILAASLACTMAMGLCPDPGVEQVQAQQVMGTAPFINSWLVAGPFEEPVADEVYEKGTADVERPEDGNWAPLAKASANSEHSAGGYEAEKAVDRNLATSWSSDGGMNPQDTYKLTLEWDYSIDVKYIVAYDRNAADGWGDSTAVLCSLYNEAGDLLRQETSSLTGNKEPGIVEFAETVPEVRKIELELLHDRINAEDYGLAEVYVLDEGADIGMIYPDTSERPEDGNWAVKASATANSVFSGSYPAANAIDGNASTEWASSGGDGVWPKMLTLSWDYAIEVKRIEALSRWSDNGSDAVTAINCKLYDENGQQLMTGVTTDPKANSVGYVEFDQAVTGVRKIELVLEGAENGNIGLREVYVLDGKDISVPEGPEAMGDISPQKGELFGAEDGVQKKWEYFDDRIYNRTYDDYQDLYGYFTVKKGLDTRGKYVYAHTYVYSPEDQIVQLRAGASGSYRLYVNDVPVTEYSAPTEVQKDMTVENVTLNAGWNKLLIGIHHTFTEDLNGNEVPTAQDKNVSYLGFYARFTDRLGAEVPGLTYSVEGPADALTIATGGLASDDMVSHDALADGKLSDSEWDQDLGFGMGLPDNNMPVGYKEWPYVWNKSTTQNSYGLSASAFQFQAAGGAPGYTWKIIEGSLPMGLELTEDGRIADGLVDGMPDLNSDKGIISIDCPKGDYTFTVQVTDAEGNTAEKEFTITVKERPNKWFEEGGVSALSHHIVMASWCTDPNFSIDQWAERAKEQGHTMVSVESLQQNYYWPSKFADMNETRHMYSPVDENGQIVDTIGEFEEAVKRYGMKFGIYYATQTTDVTVQDISDLITRYDPAYLYFDGPQFFAGTNNFDVIYSCIRNYSDEIIINSNAWGEEYGDPDLGTIEGSARFSNPGASHFVKKIVFEPWKGATFPPGGGYYPHERNDYRTMVQEMVTNIGRGYADNLEQGPGTGRGPNWDSPEVMAEYYPFYLQRNIVVREDLAAWFAPEGLPDRHEATTGTHPYFLAGYGYEDDGQGNYENFAHPSSNIGPTWGYAVARDNNIYLHILNTGADGKIGFNAAELQDKILEIGPFEDTVVSVSCLNTDESIESFRQEGETLTIDLNGVAEDPVDTIIKITTDSREREYTLTNLYLEGRQLGEDSLKIHVEGQMTFPQLKADFEEGALSFTSSDPGVAAVDSEGIVSPVSDGTAEITVTGTYEGVTRENSIKVTVKDGLIYVGEELLSAVLKVNGWEAYGEMTKGQTGTIELTGRAEVGGPIGLAGADITWHTGTVDVTAGDDYQPIVIEENDIFTVEDGVLTPKAVEEKTRAVVWAEVELDGTKVTSNRVYIDLYPYENLALEAAVTASDNSQDAGKAADGVLINGVDADSSKWSVSAEEESWLQFDFGDKKKIDTLEITFNSKVQAYVNTPKSYELQVSDNGTEWTSLATASGPSGVAWLNEPVSYILEEEARYLRLLFTGGANNGTMVDVIEVAAFGEKAAMDYAVTAVQTENGSISLGQSTAKAGEQVTVTVAPKAGYELKEGSLKVNGGTVEAVLTEGTANQYTFEMPAGAVEVTAEFEPAAEGMYTVAIGQTENGLVAVDRLTAGAGEEITLKLLANAGYGLRSLTVNSEDVTAQVSDSSYSFAMPARHVTVKASYVAISNIAPEAAAAVTSSFSDSYPASNAVDGNKETHWAARGGTEEGRSPAITLTWEEPVLAHEVNLIDRGNDQDDIPDGLLEWGDANGTIGSMEIGALNWEGQPDNRFALGTAVTITWMRFTINPDGDNYSGNENRGLAEFEVYGIPVSEIPEEPEEPEEPSVIWQLLKDTYDKVKDLDTEGVTDSAAKYYKDALANAKDILENRPDATDDELLTAWNWLVDATHNLGIVKGDKTILGILIDQAKEMADNQEKYVETYWSQLEEALKAAEEVMDDGDAITEIITPAEDALLEAILAQRLKANKENLEELIKKAEAMDVSGYTAQSVEIFQTALTAAKAVAADETLSVDDQAQVDQAEKELNEAIAALVKADDGTDDGNAGDGSSAGTDDGNTGDGSTGGKDDGTTVNQPGKTGDDAAVAFWGMIFGVALLALAFTTVLAVKSNTKRRIR